MKSMKFTTAALALLAAAVFATSAHAQNDGDIQLGIYDTSNTITKSFEADLGGVSSLTNGETWNFGSTITADLGSSSSFEFGIAATGGGGGADELGVQELVIGSAGHIVQPSDNTTVSGNIDTLINGEPSADLITSSTGVQATGGAVSNSNAYSFKAIANDNGGAYGLAGDAVGGVLASYSNGTLAADDFQDEGSGGAAGVKELGTFTFNNGVLTFNAVPEPSAYALGLVGAALFFVLRRRKGVA